MGNSLYNLKSACPVLLKDFKMCQLSYIYINVICKKIWVPQKALKFAVVTVLGRQM